jgi:hypothetical protein
VDCAFTLSGESSAGIVVAEGFWPGIFIGSRVSIIGNIVSSAGAGGLYGISVATGVEGVIVASNNVVASGSVSPLNINAASGVQVYGNLTGADEEDIFSVYGVTPKIRLQSNSGNTDFFMVPEGTGQLRVDKAMDTAGTPGNFSAAARIALKDADGTVYYIPLATSTW